MGFINAAALPLRGGYSRGAVCNRSGATMSAATETHSLNGKTINGPIQPAGQNLLVKVAEAAETTSGGLILSGSAKEKPSFGEAIEVGPGKFYGNGVKIPMAIEKGDVVLFGKYGGTDVKYDGVDHTILTQDDVLCILKGGEYAVDAVSPIFDRVLVKIDKLSDQTTSGIFVTAGSGEKSTSGKIIAMGPGRFMENGETEPAAFAVGDIVLYGKYAGTEVEFGGEEYMLIRVADIYAKY